MNTSKTTLKKTDVDGKKPIKKAGEGSHTSMKAIILGAIAVAIVIALIVGISLENLKPQLVMTINDDKVYMSDAAYYIYEAEAQGSYMDQIYQAYYGSSYWDMTDDSGVANRDSAKANLETTIEQYEILYKEAVAAGYKINDEDKESAASDVKSIRKNFTLEMKNMTGLTKKAMTSVLEKKYCADRYKQDIIDGFDIDDQKIRDGVNYDEHKQYDIQYYMISTTSYDDEGNSVEADADTKAAYKAELEELAKRAATEDFDSLTPNAIEVTAEAEATATPDTTASPEATTDPDAPVYNSTFTADGKFVAGDGTFTTDFEDIVTKMDNDAVSDVIETESGYYLVKMINNNDDEAYEEEVKNQIANEENTQFDSWYQDLVGNYTITINDEVWNDITMGNTYF